jgi:hypothetical protein
MGVEFEWRFDEDGHPPGGEGSGHPDRGGRNPLREILHKMRRLAASFRERASPAKTDDVYLSPRQRRLHADLARTRPRLRPRGRHE